VGRALASHIFRAFVAQSAHIDAIPQLLARTEQHWPDGEMQFVDQVGAQMLPNSGTPPPRRTSQPPAAAVACSKLRGCLR
jgi:hypothetical protein